MKLNYKYIISIYGLDAYKKHYESSNKWIRIDDGNGNWTKEFMDLKKISGRSTSFKHAITIDNLNAKGSTGTHSSIEAGRIWRNYYWPKEDVFISLPIEYSDIWNESRLRELMKEIERTPVEELKNFKMDRPK